MSDLPPFSGDDPTCPKCGNIGASTKYLAYGDCIHPDRDDAVELTLADLDLALNELLHRECRRCGYVWDEATVRQPKEAT